LPRAAVAIDSPDDPREGSRDNSQTLSNSSGVITALTVLYESASLFIHSALDLICHKFVDHRTPLCLDPTFANDADVIACVR